MGAVQSMCGEGERRPWWCSVPCSCSGFRRVPGQSGGKLRWPSQLLSLFSAGLFCLTYCSWVPWVPCRDTIHQNILHHTTIEGPEDAEGEKGLFQLPQEVQSLRGRFVIPEVFLFQLMSCEICTPRNLMFSTLCTVRPLILTGACFGCDLWKSINIHIEHRFSSLRVLWHVLLFISALMLAGKGSVVFSIICWKRLARKLLHSCPLYLLYFCPTLTTTTTVPLTLLQRPLCSHLHSTTQHFPFPWRNYFHILIIWSIFNKIMSCMNHV